MTPLFTKRKLQLREKLTDFLKNIPVDPFGYEKKIKINVLRYLTLAARSEGISPYRLRISIHLLEDKLQCWLYNNSEAIQMLNSQDLTELFTGENSLPNTLVIRKVKKSLKSLQEKERLEGHMRVMIAVSGCDPVAELYSEDDFLRKISIKELLQSLK